MEAEQVTLGGKAGTRKLSRRIGRCSVLLLGLFTSQSIPCTSAFQPQPLALTSKNIHRSDSKHLFSSLSIEPIDVEAINVQVRLPSAREAIAISKLPDKERRKLRKWDRMIIDLTAFREEKGHSVVTLQDVEDDPRWGELHRWTTSVRRNYSHQAVECKPRRTTTSKSGTKRHSLPEWKLRQILKLEFCWDIQSLSWEKRYDQLVEFYKEHGHSNVPANHPGQLGVFVQNCRREYRHLEQGEPSSLTVERLNKLFEVDFVWAKSREEAWEYYYNQLREFYNKFGHANVPELYPDSPALGRWCVNQRTHYRRRYQGEPSSLTEERIQLMEDLGFVWNYQRHKFEMMLKRLSKYFLEHGHINISTNDQDNQDLRYWITIQRYYYHRRKRDLESRGASSVPLTEERIQSIETAIPGFHWRVRGATNAGPSSQDWANLFDEMRKKGLQPGMPMKRHWFDGVNPFSINVKNTWTDKDLLDLWNADTGDDEDDNDSFSEDDQYNSDGSE